VTARRWQKPSDLGLKTLRPLYSRAREDGSQRASLEPMRSYLRDISDQAKLMHEDLSPGATG